MTNVQHVEAKPKAVELTATERKLLERIEQQAKPQKSPQSWAKWIGSTTFGWGGGY